jgi:uncharacterized heparinase superfamily protein
MTNPETFEFLSVAGNLDELGWDNPGCSKLWRYNQHYFDDLNAEDAVDRLRWHHQLMLRWVLENPPGQGTGWEPYPTSLRIVNWVKHALTQAPLPEPVRQNLAIQARWLTKRLEWHLMGNHLFANAKALLFAGLYFDGPEAASWRAKAVSILVRELPEQILPDGGQFELSPMYHALAVEDLADIINLMTAFRATLTPTETELARNCVARLPSMLHWLNALSHPDGRISFFNDAAFDIAPENALLHAYAGRLGIAGKPAKAGLTYLADSGYARMDRGDAVVLCDIGRIGPDYLPGHAHADTLSFELSIGDERVVVNSGTSVYGQSEERQRQRGTKAHSTVVVSNADSSEVWSGFRVARRAHVDQIQAANTHVALTISARHDGYTRLPGGPHHTRNWRLTDTGLTVTDTLNTKTQGEARYHLPPGVSAEITAHDAGTISLPSGRMLRWRVVGAIVRKESTTWHPRFGQSLPSICLALTFSGTITFDLDWT